MLLKMKNISTLILMTLLLRVQTVVKAQKFEPYQLNGGLVSAVAGRDFCVVASDTRLMDGGYEIYSRSFLTSRLWSVDGDMDMDREHDGEANGDIVIHEDGSLLVSQEGQRVKQDTTLVNTWIASAGCSADCEALKRQVRSDVRAASFWGSSLNVNQVASLLSQVLYRRRSFPFYSFCVVAGVSESGGSVYGYDAIGSYEQLAVTSAGTGRELLQPILDRLFAHFPGKEEGILSSSLLTTRSTSSKDRLEPPNVVKTQVECTPDEAISRLIRAYRSVAERDIGVGDKLVLCVTQRLDGKTSTRVNVVDVSLKRH